MSIRLEVCIASVADAHAAEQGGANRVELSTALALGGFTPTRGLLREVRSATRLPLVAMLRPRPGGCAYSPEEFRVMQRDLEDLLIEGIDGLAVGILTPSGGLDLARMEAVVRQAGPVPVVCHRAFDLVPRPLEALEQLIDLGVRRILTSGQEETAYNGIPLIRTLIQSAGDRMEILPAAGINRFTVADIVTRTGCAWVHASLRSGRVDPSAQNRRQVRFGAAGLPQEAYIDGTDAGRVEDLVARLATLG